MMLNAISKLIMPDRLGRYRKTAALIDEKENEMKALSKERLLELSEKLKSRAEGGETLDSLLPEAFALAREASVKTLGQRHYSVQLIGGMVLHEGKIAEMMTGEGKTLSATLPIYLNALSGKGVHVVTVNDYLARRDTVWMGQIYHSLGLKTACIAHDSSFIYDPSYEGSELDAERDTLGSFKVMEKFLRPVSRREAYLADITYGTNHEFGFDFLRDNLAVSLDARVQRSREFAIIDEVDSILIDEARTPLIISAADTQSSGFYKVFAQAVAQLKAEEDYALDEKLKTVSILEPGIEKVEKMLNIPNIFAPENARLFHFLYESLKAHSLFKRDRDYMVKNGEIIIVDEFTGRLLLGRRYSGGLHQAIEAKERVAVKDENRTYAQITIQNYFRLYKKISGMTGTAETSAEEFHKVYNLQVISIPPNKPVIREDLPDMIYKDKNAKCRAITEEVRQKHEKGQPILLGTTSILSNEIISEHLKRANIPHEVLNAKNNEREGAIIAQAGRLGAITVATNMAGRGVDIVLGGNPPNPEEAEKVRQAGGLFVLGTERHEARRIDNQLRGRSGRQGDPGGSRFFLSLEDDLLRIFGGERIQKMMQTLRFPDDQPIESGIVSKAVNQAQGKVEGANLDMRQHLLDFDDVLNKQRTALYARRAKILESAEKNDVLPIAKEALEKFLEKLKAFEETREKMTSEKNGEEKEKAEITTEIAEEQIQRISEEIEPERARILGEQMTRILDTLWIDHLENLESLRQSVNIRAYGQHEPLVEYRREAHKLYQELQGNYELLLYNSIFQILELDLAKLHTPPPAASASRTEIKKIGRNDPCFCGSGKKHKKCHGK